MPILAEPKTFYIVHEDETKTYYKYTKDVNSPQSFMRIFLRIAAHDTAPLVLVTDADFNIIGESRDLGERVWSYPTPVEPGRMYVHEKTQQAYEALGPAILQTDIAIKDMTQVTVYKGPDHRLWVRPTAEFNSKFTKVE
jgi:hypothetical protein